MKKYILISFLTILSFASKAQYYQLRYDSVRVVSKFKLGTVTTGSATDSLLSKKANGGVYKISRADLQPQLNGTGFVKATGTTISYDNNTYATQAYADAKVQNNLTASTVIAPSATAVNTELGLKANLTGGNTFTNTNNFDAITASATSFFNGGLSSTGNIGIKTGAFINQFTQSALTTNRITTVRDLDGTMALMSDLTSKADLASPALTGSPTAPTQTIGDNSTKIATTAYVDAAVSGGGGSSGTYTPTMANISGTSSITARKARYTRIGNIVTVFGSFDVQNSTSGFSLSITLPIASNLGSQYDLSGNSNSGVDKMGIISADIATDLAVFSATFGSTGASIPMYYSFSYEVI